MAAEIPDFEKAEYVGQPELMTSNGFEFRGDAWQEPEADHGFLKSILIGIVAAAAGSIAYAAFVVFTHIVFGLVGIFIGAFIAGVMLHETHGIGGRRYQIAAAILTYLSISTAGTLQVLYALQHAGKDLSHLNAAAYGFLTMFSVASPFFGITHGFGGIINLLILFFSVQAAWRAGAGSRINR